MKAFVELKNIYKVFGNKPRIMLEKVKEGNISKTELLEKYNHTLGLNDISLSINRSELFVIMGLSGSGKSTLVRIINRLIDPTSGQVLVDGADVTKFNIQKLLEFRKYKISMVFQKFGLMPHKTILENVAYGLEIQRIERKERERIACKWINKVGLSGYEDSRPKQLSGGMQQRVGLARALATDPEILLMDEPFSALDPIYRSEMQDITINLQKELNKTIIFITHDMDEAIKLGNRIAILKDGEVVQVDYPQIILENPIDDYVAKFVKPYQEMQGT